MNKIGSALVGLALLAGLPACGGDDVSVVGEGSPSAPDVFFAVENADALAHAALLDATDLGTGWEVTARDQFDDDSEDSGFEAAMADEPACATLTALAGLGGFFGDSNDDEPPAGRAKIEMENPTLDAMLPTSVELEVEIEETVAEILSGWGLAKELLGSDEFEGCMLAVLPKAFADEDMPEGVTFDITLRDASSPAPSDGVTMGFNIDMALGAIELNMAIEMYMWPYGNAGASAMFLGSHDSLDADLIESTLTAFEQRLADAAA